MVWFHCNTVTALNIFKTTGLSAKHFLRRLVNQPKSPPNPSTFSLLSSSHLAIQQELCQEKLIFQVGKFVCGRGGGGQSCDKSTVKLLTTAAFCDMLTVDCLFIDCLHLYLPLEHSRTFFLRLTTAQAPVVFVGKLSFL